MQNAHDLWSSIGENLLRAFHREVTDADEPFGLKRDDDFAQMLIANLKEPRPLVRRQFVRRAVAAAFFHEDERAVVNDKMFGEEFFRGAETFAKQLPQTLPADFGARTIESPNESFRMLL